MRAGLLAASVAAVVVTLSLTVGPALAQETQPAPLITEDMAVSIDSGLVSNEGAEERVIFTDRVFIPGAAALRLRFEEVDLSGFVADGTGSYLRLTSLFDGAQQRLDARHVEQWRHTSAYFNGDEVVIEIVAQPGTGDNRLVISSLMAQFEPMAGESICGPTDDRQPSTDNRSARLLPVGCTGWLIEDCNHCFLTAGHCSTSNNSVQVVEFNVPLSNSEGGLNHPPPEDQFAVDLDSRQSNNGQGVGNDYAYFGVFPNSNTGLTPFETYGDAFILAVPPPVQGQEIRITGFGTTGNGVPREWNQAQKTHAGPYFSFGGTTVSYQTDTTGGNSGSPVIDDSTGLAIGIHTHGGCGSNSGNYGTGLNHSGVQNYLDNPRGVCECPSLLFFFPDGLVDVIDPRGGTQVVVQALPNGGAIPEPGTGVLYVDSGSGFDAEPMTELADNVYLATFPATECGSRVRYYFSADTTDGNTAFEPADAPLEYFEAVSAEEYTVVIDEDFEDAGGWTVVDQNVDRGSWDIGNPVVNGGSAPRDDFDGSGACALTGNFLGRHDVDGGPTRLLSPEYDISDLANPFVGFARWFVNEPRDEDRLSIHISGDNGQSWTLVKRVAHVGRQWVVDGFRVRDYLPDASRVRVRFSVADNPDDSDTEAAIDAFSITELDCGGCDADFNGDGVVNTQDVVAFLNAWAGGDAAADFNGDGQINSQDVIAFLNAWNTGC